MKALGIGDAVGTRRMNRVPRAVQGYYETRARYIAVRSRQAGNYTVTMHEVFHHLADRLGMTGTQDMVSNLDPVFAASYDPAELPGEAFAEFGWRYMEDKALARQFAGDAFVDQFEARLRQEGLQKTVHDAARQLRIWLNATVNERIGATIVDKSKAGARRGSIREQLQALISRHIDDTAAAEPINASIREATGDRTVPLGQDVRANALMKNFAARRAFAILTENLTDASWTVTGESLAARFERVGLRARDEKLLNEYMLALHSLDRDAQGKPVFDMATITPAQRQQLIDDVQQNHPEVAEAEQEFQAFRREFMQAFMVDTGYLTQENFDAMNATYPHYVPTFRVKGRRRSGSRGNGKTFRIRRATGSTEDIVNPMDSFVGMVDSIVTMVSANNAALAWDSAYHQYEGLGVFGREITPDMRQVSVNVSDLQRQIAQILSGHTDSDVFQQVIDLVGVRQTQWVPQTGANMANVMTVQRADGSVGYYEIFDPELYKLLASQRDGSGSSNRLLTVLGKLTRTMSMLTTGSNPVFAVRNFMRDFQNSVNYGSWASNYYNGWKTNKAHYVNSKCIIPTYGCFARGYKPDKYGRYKDTLEGLDARGCFQVLDDLEKALDYLDKGETPASDLSTKLQHAANSGRTTVSCKYFMVTFYKKGTCHIKFHDQKIVDRLNIYVGRQRTWLPPTYGSVHYDQMDDESKRVVDEFQGREKYEAVINCPNDYIIETKAAPLLLM